MSARLLMQKNATRQLKSTIVNVIAEKNHFITNSGYFTFNFSTKYFSFPQ